MERTSRLASQQADFRVLGDDGVAGNTSLTSFLEASGLRLLHLDRTAPVRGRVARLGDVAAAHVYMSVGELEWPEDPYAHDRLVVLWTRSGRLHIQTKRRVFTRDPRISLVAPGDEAVRFTTERETEVLYLSFNAALVADVPLPTRQHATLPAASSQALGALSAIVTAICESPVDDPDAALVVRPLAEQAAREAVRVALGRVAQEVPLLGG